jgi:hypothetical protein
MKLKYFLTLVGAFGITIVILLVTMCKSDEPPPKPEPALNTPPVPRPQPPTPTPTPARASGELAARPYDAEVIAWATRSISGDKQKDVSKGKSYKINVYKDAGHSTVNRAKVDVNRNDKWDEKYSFEPDRITLEIAPADDEQYTQTYHWTGSAWLPEGAEPADPVTPTNETAAEPSAPSTANVDLPARGYDAEVLAWKDRTAAGGKLKDVSKGKSYKINVYQDAGASHINRAKVDVNRNDKWDEKYTFEPSKITLQRAPADDEHYTETYHWTGNGWSKQ